MLTTDKDTYNAYQYCMAIAQNHYENFPVASKLLNKQLRFAISAVYAFARSADDFADEGELSTQQRLTLLEEYSAELNHIEQQLTCLTSSNEKYCRHDSENKIFIALADVIRKYQIPMSLFYDLLSAFKQDVTTTRYSSFDDILAYCRLSANPVGRILLYLNHSAAEENLKYSDAICTGLQLLNFYQDIAQDIDENDRLYLPVDEMQALGVSLNDIKNHIDNRQTQALLKKQLARTKNIYRSGMPLCYQLKGRFALEIRTIYAGGQLVLEKLEQNSHTIYLRPRLSRKDKLKLIWQGLFFKHYFTAAS